MSAPTVLRRRPNLWSAPPLAAFLIVYIPTCWLGAMALVAGPDWVREWYVRLSGASIDELSGSRVLIVLVLLNVAPALLFGGWWLSGRIVARLGPPPEEPLTLAWPGPRLLATVYTAVAAYLLIRLGTLGVFGHIKDWTDYESFIGGRYGIVGQLRFSEFVLIYSILPLAAGSTLVSLLNHYSGAALWLRAAPVLGSMAAIELLLFQKQPLLVALLMVALFVLFGRVGRVRSERRTVALIAGGIAGAYVVYIVLLVTPVAYTKEEQPPAPPGNLVVDRFTHDSRGWETAGWFLIDGAKKALEPGRTGEGLGFTTTKDLTGVAYATHVVGREGSHWSLRLALRAHEPTRVRVFLGDQDEGSGGGFVDLTRKWVVYRFKWTPEEHVDDITIALRPEEPGHVVIDDVRFGPAGSKTPAPEPKRKRRGGGTATLIAPPLATQFPSRDQLDSRPRAETLFFYALLGPITRTAGPAVAYPTLYPDKHPYYPIDLGLDVAGIIDTAPNDNVTSFDLMFPSVSSTGSNNVPYPFVLYSQGGVLVALIGSVVLGVLWGLLWRLTAWMPRGMETAGLQTLLVVAGVFLAGNAWRNSVFASYGLGWPALVLLAVMVARIVLLRRVRPAWTDAGEGARSADPAASPGDPGPASRP